MTYRITTADHDPHAALHDGTIVLGDFLRQESMPGVIGVYLTDDQVAFVRRHSGDPRRHRDPLNVRVAHAGDRDTPGVVLSLAGLEAVPATA